MVMDLLIEIMVWHGHLGYILKIEMKILGVPSNFILHELRI